MIDNYIEFVKNSGFFNEKRNEQLKYLMFETINENLHSNFYNNPIITDLLSKLEGELLNAKKSSYAAAKEALDAYSNLKNRE
jgi:LAO/AO transport system kinase